jgi:acyl-CoA synthetase (NDP forming)
MAGSVSVVSQSGTLGSLAMVDVSDQSVGFSKFISSGNEADLHMEDFIEYFANDPETKVIFAFIEGVRNGRKFFRVAKKATKNKPFIVIKGGTTEFGAKAASSHTGAIAGSTTAYDVAFKQTGITKAVDERDVINLIKAFSLLPLPKGRKVGIVSGWGGKGVLASDACAKEGLEILELREEAIEKLNQFLPPFWSHRNPIDLTGAGLFGDFSALLSKSIEVLLDDKNIDAVIFTIPSFKSVFESVLPRMDPNISPALSGTSMGFLAKSEEKIAKNIVGLKKKYQKPIVGIAIGLSRQKGSKGVKFLENNGVPVYETPSEAARVLSKMLDYRRYVERLKEAKI